MRNYIKNKSQLFIMFLIVGFFVGIICGNMIMKENFYNSNFLGRDEIKSLEEAKIITEEFLLYVIKERIFWIGSFCLIGALKWRKLGAVISLLVFAFLNGIMCEVSISQCGVLGILAYVMGMMPQFIFYLAGASMLISYWFEYPDRRWNGTKTIFVIVMFVVGILTEAYVNPWVVKSIVKIIL